MDRDFRVVFDHFELRVIHADSLSTEARFAKDNKTLARRDHLLHVMQVEPTAHERFAQGVCVRLLQSCLEDFFPSAKTAQRSFDYFAAKTNGNVAFLVRKFGKLRSVFVTTWKMREQILYGLDAETT